MQSDFYTTGPYGQPGLQPFSMEKAIAEHADYVVFNGSVGALTGPGALTAKTGETVRLFFGVGGPNVTSSFHVIGEIFDHVQAEGNTNVITENVQTTMVPAGGSAIVDFRVNVPGTYILVDHSLTRAFNKGALGMLKVTGTEDKVVYSGKTDDAIYSPEGGSMHNDPKPAPVQAPAANKAERIARGATLYANCIACHQATGLGIPNAFHHWPNLTTSTLTDCAQSKLSPAACKAKWSSMARQHQWGDASAGTQR